MKSNFFLRLFPTPNYLTMPAVAIDLSDRSLKYCSDFQTFGERAIPAGAIENGRIKNAAPIIEALTTVAKTFPTQFIVASLPEEPGFTFVVSLPAVSRENLRGAIELQLEEYIPLPASGVIFDYEVLREPTSDNPELLVVVSAFPKDLVSEYVKLFADAGLTLIALEGEIQAAARSLLASSEKGTVLVIDLGKAHTSFSIIVDGLSVLTSTVTEIGGDFLTAAVERGLGVKTAEAEELKQKRGLLQSKENSLVPVLLPAVSVLRDEISKFLSYWDSQVESGSQSLPVVSRAILTGGQATIPGLAEYLGSGLGLKVEIGNVWKNILDVKFKVPPLTLNQSVHNAVVLGLILRQSRRKTTSLLPPEQVVVVGREYRRRRRVVVGWAILVIITISVVLAGSLVLVDYVQPLVSENLPTAPAPLDPALMKRVNILTTWQADNLGPASLFKKIIELKPAGVSLDGLALVHSGGASSIELSGVATRRRDLLDFLDQLRSEKTFSAVESPVSNLIKDGNATFTIKLTIARKSGEETKVRPKLLEPDAVTVAKINNYFVTALTVPDLFENLEQMAAGSRVVFNLTQADVVDARLNFHFTATGTYADLEKFLSQVEAMPRALSFSSLRINKVANGSSGEWRADAAVQLFSYEQ